MVRTLAHLFAPRVSNNRRPRIIHPEGYLVLTGIALVVHLALHLLPASLQLGSILGYASDITQVQVIDLTNQRRASVGLPPLQLNDKLSRAASEKAQHMFVNQYWAHFAPDGTTPWQFIKEQEYSYLAAGENLAKDFGDTASMVQAWMDSKTHRENLLNSKYSEIGVAVVNGELQGVETTLVVQMFGQPNGGSESVEAPVRLVPTPAPEPNIQGESEQQSQNLAEESTPAQLTASPEIESQDQAEKPAPVALDSTSVQGLETELRQFFSLMNPLRISKAIFFAMVVLLLIVLVYDFQHASENELVRLVGKNIAHIILLIFILVIVLIIDQGKLL